MAHAAPRLTIVTPTPPTPNGDLHLGHLAGPFVAADIYTRYLRLRGRRVRLVCGTDDHQSYVAHRAAQLGVSPEQAAARFGDDIEATLRAARVELDSFTRPLSSPSHDALVVEGFERMHAEGRLQPRDRPWLFCAPCGQWLYEVYVSGRCPHCGAGTAGGGCEACGRPNDCVDLGDPRCRGCGGTPEVRPRRQLVIELPPLIERMREYVASAVMSARARALCEWVLHDAPAELPVTHPGAWGMPVPLPGWEDQRLHVYAEEAFGYLALVRDLALRDPELANDALWQGEGTEVVQFMGFDNVYFHGILNPALFYAHGGVQPPRTLVVNEFYHLDGSKFSTSRNHAIWGRELLAVAAPDLVRFYLAWSAPEREQTNFTLADFGDTVRRELVDGWQSWLRDLGRRLDAATAGQGPDAAPLTAEQHAFAGELRALHAEVTAGCEPATFSLQRAARALCEVARRARRFGADQEGWARVPSRTAERRAALGLELAAARALAVLATPVMPDFGARLLADLDAAAAPATWDGALDGVRPGARVRLAAAAPWFELPATITLPDPIVAAPQPAPA